MIRRSRRSSSTTEKIDDLICLWLLRMLIPLGAHQELIGPNFIKDDALAIAIGFGKWIDCEDGNFDPKVARIELRRLHTQAEKNLRGSVAPSALASNISRLSTLVGLSTTDCRILEFAVLIHNERLLDDTADKLGNLSSAKVFHVLSILLGLPEAEIRSALSPQGTLAQSGLVSVDRNGARMLRGKLDLLSDSFPDRMLSAEEDPVL